MNEKHSNLKILVMAVFILHFLCAAGPKIMAQETSPEFPSGIILLPENQYAIFVEKDTQRMQVYRSSGGDSLEKVFESDCATGEVAGPKQVEGDRKTPEGVYFLVDEYKEQYLTPIYGKKAFPIDYPNFLDHRLGKNGSAIWIHGTDKPLKPMSSNGCLVMENNDILSVSAYIALHATPLIISDKIQMITRAERDALKGMGMQLIAGWTEALTTGSYQEFLGHYSETYLPDISWWEHWLQIRSAAGESSEKIRIESASEGIYQQGGIIVILMDVWISAGEDKKYLGKKKWFVSQSPTGLKILGDSFQTLEKAYQTGTAPFITAALLINRSEPPRTSEDVIPFIEGWLKAWSSKDMKTYGASYARGFFSEGMDKKTWVTRKSELAKRYNYIKVTGSDYKVIKKKDGVEVRFFQNYESSGLTTRGIKNLKLIKEDGQWMILQETWKGK